MRAPLLSRFGGSFKQKKRATTGAQPGPCRLPLAPLRRLRRRRTSHHHCRFSASANLRGSTFPFADGECSVERDFSRFFARSSNKGPRSSSTGRDDLTPFSRECACLWRQLYGARSGHFNPAATRAAAAKATARRGPLRRATVGVLAAARLATQCKRARLPTSAAAVAPGAGTDRRPQWTEKMQEFHNRSRRNIPGVTQVRTAPGGAFLKPPGVELAARRGALPPPPPGPCPHRNVAVLAASGVTERSLRSKGCKV